MTEWTRALNALAIAVLSLILLSALSMQIFDGQVPCPLCYLQRLGMVGIAMGAVLNVATGLRPAHYGLSLASCVFGGAVALRHIALHACPQFDTFGVPFMGLGLYTWSFITHSAAVLFIALLLFFQERAGWELRERRLNWWELVSIALLIFAVSANIVVALFHCGVTYCPE